MKRETYIRMTESLRQREGLAKALYGLDKGITAAIYVAYPAALVWLFLGGAPLGVALKALLIPAFLFVCVSAMRQAFNRPRPYEVFDAPPVFPRNKKGQSFPSRHAFSIFVIGITFLFVLPWTCVGVVVCVLGVLLAAVRVLLGFHFPQDCVAGALIGVAFALIGFMM